ncbi:MAG: hypothetical protein A2537_00245 [Candidatus Magasanikbacteria bacterium RIFOXYD2_FULL_36_9]|uniref:Uncharacterized protein n=1 Tax=Candidatus Magasanikbacteria bacterium RIFOXYD2_FULL_36_9 TaxID=1798707 RepID=A0A1F6NX93_9BACT|nr:MAG: hypothetical protein A2537_00245 [Candidatus Magasanikbacteria bacterium RIFOXYD2_FULL_36_9]
MAQPHFDNLNKNGFAVLIGVLIVGAFGAAVVVYLILSGLYSYQNSFILEQSNTAKASTNACAEIALNKIQLCSSTVGVGNVQIGNNNCEYNIISNGDQLKTIQASSQIGTVVRRLKVTTNQIDPKIVIESWQEVPSF